MTEFIEICGKFYSNQRKNYKMVIPISQIASFRSGPDKPVLLYIDKCLYSSEPTKDEIKYFHISEEEYERIKIKLEVV